MREDTELSFALNAFGADAGKNHLGCVARFQFLFANNLILAVCLLYANGVYAAWMLL
jgi:hypothetical protein